MPKKQTYSIPLTLRLSPAMMEFVDSRAREQGVTPVDFVRHAIAFNFWESTWLRTYLQKELGERPFDHLAEFEEVADNSSNARGRTYER